MKVSTLIKLAPIAIGSAVLALATAVAPSLAGEVGVSNSYSIRCITDGKYRSTFISTEQFNGVRNSYETATKVEVDGKINTIKVDGDDKDKGKGNDRAVSGDGYVATSSAYQETKGTFNTFTKVEGSNDYNFVGSEYSHSVSAFSN